ncbi:cobaltochelatase subunit CobN, partial [Candidatus Desantisbacteria bacterium]|nr:cobaltochelatase subunit CobN [Candidatus Desantisbacteria bacterium]
MCRNRKGRGQKLLLLFCVLCSVFCVLSSAHAESLQVSLLLGDINSKVAIEAARAIESQYPQLEQKINFKIYTSHSILNKSQVAKDIARAKVIFFLLIMDRQAVELAKPYIEQVIKNGGKVYGVGGNYTKEHRDMGIIDDEMAKAYYRENGVENIKNMVLLVMNRDLGLNVSYEKPTKFPEFGIYRAGSVFESFEDYKKCGLFKEERPWIGVVFWRSSLTSNQTKPLHALLQSLEQAGFNPLPVFGYPSHIPVERFFLDENGKSRVRLVVAMGMNIGVNPEVTIPTLSKLNVPVINAITLYTQSLTEWETSPVGLDILERTWQVALPELGGLIQPTVIASKERMVVPLIPSVSPEGRRGNTGGIEYIEEKPIPERIERLVDRVKAWINLQDSSNKDKKVAIIYYNYPPGKQNIGASYLNVLPESLWEILNRLRAENYDIGSHPKSKDELFNDIHSYGRNIGNWAPAEIDKLARSGGSTSGSQAVLIPIKVYKQWFEELPEGFKASVLKSWGSPESNNIMTWQGNIVIPAVRYGNILFTAQPSRGWEQDVKKLYHDITMPPHHQYIAFYLWLKKGFGADALAHIGTHGTHEWLSGKEVGFTAEDPPEALIQDIPNIYPYIVDDVGEGLQAKRRGMAVVIDHMTPPFDKAGMNQELKELASFISDYNSAKEKSPQLATVKLEEINVLSRKMGILTDLSLSAIATPEQVEKLDDYIREIGEKTTPFGLHTFGKSPDEKYRKSTAEAILSIEGGLGKQAELEERIAISGQRELDAFVAALSGRYIPA